MKKIQDILKNINENKKIKNILISWNIKIYLKNILWNNINIKIINKKIFLYNLTIEQKARLWLEKWIILKWLKEYIKNKFNEDINFEIKIWR